MVRATKVPSFEAVHASDEEILVTRIRHSGAKDDLLLQPWEALTACLVHVDMRDEDFFRMKAVQNASPVMIDVAARNWEDHINLVGIIAELASRCP